MQENSPSVKFPHSSEKEVQFFAGNATLRSLFPRRFGSHARPFQTDELDEDDGARPLAESLLLAVADLLFCPDFTVHSHRRGPVSAPPSL